MGLHVRRLAGALSVLVLTISAYATSNGPAHALSPTFGWLDSITIYDDGTLRVRGWAMTADFPTTALGIRVLVDGALATPNYRMANEYRPDVGDAYPGYGDYHGFDFTVPAPDGSHTVTIQAQNSGVYNLISGSKSYSMSNLSRRLFRGNAFPAVPGATLSWTYHRSDVNPYRYRIDDATATWNSTSTNLNLVYTTSTNASVRYFAGDYGGTYQARSYTYPCPNPSNMELAPGCTYSYTNVFMDTIGLASKSNAHLQKVAAHEFGHAAGLAHPPNNYSSVMLPGTVGSGTPVVAGAPTAQDVARFNRLYTQGYWDTP